MAVVAETQIALPKFKIQSISAMHLREKSSIIPRPVENSSGSSTMVGEANWVSGVVGGVFELP
jgi:hypothetical protein